MTNMYDDTATWNPFKGCEFDCVYCKPSFQQQSKRWGKNNCEKCYNYEPHFHPERLDNIPSADIIFVCGSADISFCSTENVMKIIDAIKEHKPRKDKTYYFQSKYPNTFERFKDELTADCVLITTFETNIYRFSDGSDYSDYSNAYSPLTRFRQFRSLDYDRKVVTMEPLMEFDEDILWWLNNLRNLEYVWMGFNTRPKQVSLPEPPIEDVKWLIEELRSAGIEVRGKDLRGIELTGDNS